MQTGESAVPLPTLLLLLPIFLTAAAAPVPPADASRQVLLVSLDGFRHDYLTKYAKEAEFLRLMASQGVHVKAMTPEFLTKTFPNHWTMVTGRHQESHGIVSNAMYDPVFNASFTMATTEARWWNDSEPIWVTARRQGLKVATLAWPGGDVDLPGGNADHVISYEAKMSDAERVETVIKWLTEDLVDLCFLYFAEPDHSGHGYGPNSPQVASAIARLDSQLRSLVSELRRKGFRDKVDLIVASDHGMSELSTSRLVDFNGSLDRFVARYMDSGPHLSMFAKPGMKQQLVQFLQNETDAKNLPIRVFTKETLPQRFHYSSHRRIPDVLVLPKLGYAAIGRNESLLAGHHGYDNTYDEMKVPLIAFGPSFRRGAVVDGFRQVDIYGLMCHLLRIQPQPNNGSLELLPTLLSSSAGQEVARSAAALALAVGAGLLVRGGV